MYHLKSYKLFEYVEIPWEIFEEFIQEVQDVFVHIMDEKLLIGDVGQYGFEYQDDFVFLKIKKTNDPYELWGDIDTAIKILSHKFKVEVKSSEVRVKDGDRFVDVIKLVIRLIEKN